MKVIIPATITDAMLISSTVAEPDIAPDAATDPAAYDGGTTYALGDRASLSSTHRIYESLQAGNVGHSPELEASAEWWAEVQGTNRWAMFDSSTSSATVEAEQPLVVVLAPGVVNCLALVNCAGTTATVSMTNGDGGPTVYGPVTLNLQAPAMGDWYAYFFDPFRSVPVFVLADLPPYLNGRITVSIASEGAAECGVLMVGRSYTIGETHFGVSVGIRDYSKKTTSTTGQVSLVQGKFAKTMRADVLVRHEFYAETVAVLESLRSTPAIWIGDTTGDITPLSVFGFYKDFQLSLDYPTQGRYALEIEGLA